MGHTHPFRCLLLTAAGALLPLSALRAQTIASPEPVPVQKNVIKLAPLALIHGQLPFTVESRIGYERVVGRHNSLMGSYSYLGTNYAFNFLASAALSAAISSAFAAAGHPGIVWTQTRIRTSGYRYQLQLRHYLGHQRAAPEGWYLAPHVSYSQATYDVTLKDFGVRREIRRINRNANLLIGYQRVLGRHLTFDIFTGLGYRQEQTRISQPDGLLVKADETTKGLKVSSGLNVGWAF